MKNEVLYHKTVDILVQAYFNDTLISSDCNACAVGNLVAANSGYKIIKVNDNVQWFENNNPINSCWQNVVVSEIGHGLVKKFVRCQNTKLSAYSGKARKQIDSTGYSVQEFADIEFAFEKGYYKKIITKDRMFDALMAVIDVLDKIHENKDEQITQTSKKKFQHQLA